jgi:uncharacterized UPF0146 family protein
MRASPCVLPGRVLAAYRNARRVVEVGAGASWGTPGCEVLVTDTDPRVLGAPAPLRAAVDDAFRPQRALYEGAALLLAVRAPEELQVAVAALARAVGADVLLLPLGQELAHLDGWRHEAVQGWHWLRRRS